MIMFLGMISSANSGGSFWRRVRLRRAMATARLASFCPMTCLSSSTPISRGGGLWGAGAVAGGDGNGAFGVFLSDDVFVEFDHDLAGSEFVEGELFFFGAAG